MCGRLVIILLAIFYCISPASALPLAILQTGDVLLEDVPKDKQNWYGLYLIDNSYTLLSVAVAVEPYFHELADSESDRTNRSKWSGRTVTVKPKKGENKLALSIAENNDPLILVQLKTLTEGKLLTAFPRNEVPSADTTESPSVLNSVSLSLGGLSLGETSCRLDGNFQKPPCEVWLECGNSLVRGDTKKMNKQLIMSSIDESKNLEQMARLPYESIFCTAEYSSQPTLVWAGDMDRDGKIDLLVEHQADSTYSQSLFLSSFAESGQLVKFVARFTRPSGC